MSIRIIADENIPYVGTAFATLGDVEVHPGHAITAAAVEDADVLLVRSVTDVDENLLDGAPVQFVGSATTGTDHVDQAYLRDRDITFAHAPGANATSVADYVIAALLHLAAHRQESLRGKTVGIVGCGNVGGRLARRLPALGLRVLRNDPPLADKAQREGREHDFVPLEHVLDASDIVTLHVPLTREGPYPTHRLFNETVLRALDSDAWFINTSRGAVVDSEALCDMLGKGKLGAAVLDVWTNEPTPAPSLVREVDLATPHVAGYAFDGKVRGTEMVYQALTNFLEQDPAWDAQSVLTPDSPDTLRCTSPDPALPEVDWLHNAARQMYDVGADDARLRAGLGRSSDEWGLHFRRLRRDYPRRREFSQHRLPASTVPAAYRNAAEDGLEIQLEMAH